MTTKHANAHELAGKTVTVTTAKPLYGCEETTVRFVVEDWWDRVGGGSWMFADGNPACMNYAIRSGFSSLPLDDEVVYGKVGGLGHLVHVSEIAPTVYEAAEAVPSEQAGRGA